MKLKYRTLQAAVRCALLSTSTVALLHTGNALAEDESNAEKTKNIEKSPS